MAREFRAYLQGIETWWNESDIAMDGWFRAYLQGIETNARKEKSDIGKGFEPTYKELKQYFISLSPYPLFAFRAYLQGIETRTGRGGIFLVQFVSSLPTRN